MTTITIPKRITKGAELIIVPREDYEDYARWRKAVASSKTFKPTKTQLKDLAEARKEHQKGIYLTIHELKRKLDVRD